MDRARLDRRPARGPSRWLALFDPQTYLERLRAIRAGCLDRGRKDFWSRKNCCPDAGRVQGTTGYDFLNQLNGLFVEPSAEKCLTDFYAEFTGETANCASQ